jgi:hypothetical protein
MRVNSSRKVPGTSSGSTNNVLPALLSLTLHCGVKCPKNVMRVFDAVLYDLIVEDNSLRLFNSKRGALDVIREIGLEDAKFSREAPDDAESAISGNELRLSAVNSASKISRRCGS